jgi:radical SAM protein with 4Fe4S-binding SPASM domain
VVQKETCTPAITSSSRPTCSANIAKHHLIDPVGSERQQRLGLDKREALPRYCLDCDLRFACHGGCPTDRFTATPDEQPGLHYLCSSFSCSSTTSASRCD